MPKSLKKRKKTEVIEDLKLTEQEKEYKEFWRQRIEVAKSQRFQAFPEFDYNTYMNDFTANHLARNSILSEAMNDGDVLINTGIVEKKGEMLVNELVGMNLQTEIHSYTDSDQQIEELGQAFTDIIKRTRMQENDEQAWIEFYFELIFQRAAFYKEIFEDKIIEEKKKKKNGKGFEITKRHLRRPRFVPLSGEKIFLGDISIPARRFNDQPYIIEYDKMSYDEGATLYGDMKRWPCVRPGGPQAQDWYDGQFEYRLADLEKNEIEVLHCYDRINDEYYMEINGVPMTEVGEQLPWESDGYNIKMITVKPTGASFAYGKAPGVSAKLLYGLSNEMIRNIIRKWRQGLEPPLATKKGKVPSRDLWNPGSVQEGWSADDFSKLIDHHGVTSPEVAIYNMVGQEIEQFMGVPSIMQGQGGKKKTATETTTQMQQAVKALGLVVVACMYAKNEAALLRIPNILENMSDPIDRIKLGDKYQNIYATFSVENSRLPNDTIGTKNIVFTDTLPNETDQTKIEQEENLAALEGKHVHTVYVDIKKVREIPLNWFATTSQSERPGSALDKVMFQDRIKQANDISEMSQGEVKVDWQKQAQDMELVWQRKGIFQKQAPQSLSQPGQPQPGQDQGGGSPDGGQSKTGAQMEKGLKFATKKPGIKTAMAQGQ